MPQKARASSECAVLDFLTQCAGAQVDIDEIAAQRIKKESPAPSAFIPEDSPPDLPSCSSNLDNPDIQESRAAAFAIILAVVNGKSRVRLQVDSFSSLTAQIVTSSTAQCLIESLNVAKKRTPKRRVFVPTSSPSARLLNNF